MVSRVHIPKRMGHTAKCIFMSEERDVWTSTLRSALRVAKGLSTLLFRKLSPSFSWPQPLLQTVHEAVGSQWLASCINHFCCIRKIMLFLYMEITCHFYVLMNHQTNWFKTQWKHLSSNGFNLLRNIKSHFENGWSTYVSDRNVRAKKLLDM